MAIDIRIDIKEVLKNIKKVHDRLSPPEFVWIGDGLMGIQSKSKAPKNSRIQVRREKSLEEIKVECYLNIEKLIYYLELLESYFFAYKLEELSEESNELLSLLDYIFKGPVESELNKYVNTGDAAHLKTSKSKLDDIKQTKVLKKYYLLERKVLVLEEKLFRQEGFIVQLNNRIGSQKLEEYKAREYEKAFRRWRTIPLVILLVLVVIVMAGAYYLINITGNGMEALLLFNSWSEHIGITIFMGINSIFIGYIVKVVYDRHFNSSEIKNFKELLRTKIQKIETIPNKV